MTFRLYDISTGGAALDTDKHTVEVTDGLFNTGIDFDQSHFDGGELWLGVKIGADSEMAPRQELRPVPYALSLVPGADIIGSALVALHAESTHTSGRGIRGYATATSGTNIGVQGLSMSPSGYGGYFYNNEGGFGVCGSGKYGVYGQGEYGGYFNGKVYVRDNVGIGTTSPGDKLDVNGDIRVRGSDIKDTGGTARITLTDNGRLDLKEDGGSTSLSIATNGNVGIGTTSPSKKLEVAGDTKIGKTDAGHYLKISSSNWPEIRYQTPTDDEIMRLGVAHADNSGHGVSSGDWYVYSDSTKKVGIVVPKAGGVLLDPKNSGNVGIGTTSPGEKLTVRGNVLIESESTGMAVVELGEGLDYAEGFDVSDMTGIAPGTVLIIDPNHPGKLTISDIPYDVKVAGIVAGANETGSGVRLGADQFDFDVALAGRVYCNVDATEAGVEPGDLLTTSATPGYAMKVIDYKRAQGAILGKAMERLEEGEKGQILVLVTLQ
jgi:hypothetical protein